MKLATSILTLVAGTIVLVSGVSVAQQGGVKSDVRSSASDKIIHQLQQQNQNLNKSLIHAKEQEKKAKADLNKIRLELEALNMYPLGTDDQRLIQAVANRKVLEGRLERLETAATDLTTQVREYLKHVLDDDEVQRVNLESSIRGLDESLGIIDKPRPQIDLGTLHEAKVISIDSQSGALILNAGETQQVRIGMTFRILRGKSQIAEARIAEVRSEVSGALVIRLDDTNNAVRPGDIASIKTQN